MSILFSTNVSHLHSNTRSRPRNGTLWPGPARRRVAGWLSCPSAHAGSVANCLLPRDFNPRLARSPDGVLRALTGASVKPAHHLRLALMAIYCFVGAAVCVANLVPADVIHHYDFLVYLLC